MKKQYLFLAVAGIALMTACSSDSISDVAGGLQPTSEDSNTPVGFGVYMSQGKAGTRSATGPIVDPNAAISTGDQAEYAGGYPAINDLADLQKVGFGVYGFYTGGQSWNSFKNWNAKTDMLSTSGTKTSGMSEPNFMWNQQVKANGTEWTYEPLKYWPNGNDKADSHDATAFPDNGKVSFFAYAPYIKTKYGSDDDGNETKDVAFPDNNIDTNTEEGIKRQCGISLISGAAATGDPIIMYSLSTVPQNNTDLLWGYCAGDKYSTVFGTEETGAAAANGEGTTTDKGATNIDLAKVTTGQKIKFTFKHALATIGGNETSENNTNEANAAKGLQVVLDMSKPDGSIAGGTKPDDTKVTIKYIRIHNGNVATETTTKEGDEEVVTTSTAVTEDVNGDGKKDSQDVIPAEANFDLATGEWFLSPVEAKEAPMTSPNPLNHYVVAPSFDKLDKTITAPAKDKEDMADAIAEPATVTSFDELPAGVTTTAQNVYKKYATPLFFIPGTKPVFQVTVCYVIRTKDANLNKGYSEVEQTVTKAITFPEVKMNTKYSLIIHLGLTDVKFDAKMDNWDTESTGSTGSSIADQIQVVNIPQNETDPTK